MSSTEKTPTLEPTHPLYLLVEFGGLKPDARVLDIGCGNGRIAVPLTEYLTSEGSYEGFDVIEERIEKCGNRVGPGHPNFRFQKLDIYSQFYNPEGTILQKDLRFPFEDSEFDFVILYSVFTHMLPEAVERYFSEIARVLKQGGRMLSTYFLLNEQSLDLLERRVGGLHFDHDFGIYRVRNPEFHEGVVSYREEYVLGLYERFGLRLVHPVGYANWAARTERPWGQDWIIAEKA